MFKFYVCALCLFSSAAFADFSCTAYCPDGNTAVLMSQCGNITVDAYTLLVNDCISTYGGAGDIFIEVNGQDVPATEANACAQMDTSCYY